MAQGFFDRLAWLFGWKSRAPKTTLIPSSYPQLEGAEQGYTKMVGATVGYSELEGTEQGYQKLVGA